MLHGCNTLLAGHGRWTLDGAGKAPGFARGAGRGRADSRSACWSSAPPHDPCGKAWTGLRILWRGHIWQIYPSRGGALVVCRLCAGHCQAWDSAGMADRCRHRRGHPARCRSLARTHRASVRSGHFGDLESRSGLQGRRD